MLGTERRLPRLERTPMQRLRLGVLAASAEHDSEHPLARAVLRYVERQGNSAALRRSSFAVGRLPETVTGRPAGVCAPAAEGRPGCERDDVRMTSELVERFDQQPNAD